MRLKMDLNFYSPVGIACASPVNNHAMNHESQCQKRDSPHAEYGV